MQLAAKEELMQLLRLIVLSLILGASMFGHACAEGLDDWLRQLQAMDQSQDPSAARQAWKQIADLEAGSIPAILEAFDSAGPTSANWLRSAVDAIAEKSLASSQKLPQDELEKFVLNLSRSPRARRLAYEWVRRVDPSVEQRLVPQMLDDPSTEMRRDAVGMRIEVAEEHERQKRNSDAIEEYRSALGGARDEDQVKLIAERMRALKQNVDLPRHFGFLQEWHAIGPFDNTNLKGFETEFAPEKEIDFSKEYQGKSGTVSWIPVTDQQDDFGMIDLNKPLGELKEVTGYVWTEYEAETARDVELRLGCKNAWKLWLNGELLFARDEYHRGMKMDQYKMKGRMKAGKNQILMKLCQNEMVESWTVEWQFQLRVCDETGTAILSAAR